MGVLTLSDKSVAYMELNKRLQCPRNIERIDLKLC